MRTLILVAALLVGCGSSPPPEPPPTCQEQLVFELSEGTAYQVALANFLDCANLSIWDLARLLLELGGS